MLLALTLVLGTPVVENVGEVRARLPKSAGAVVRVRGWLSPNCGGFSCSIHGKPPGAPAGADVRLSLAAGSPVEHELGRLSGREVVITARVGVAVRDDEIFTDRAPELIPLQVISR